MTHSPPWTAPDSPSSQFRFDRVSLKGSLGSQLILQPLTFEIFPGDRVMIAGHTGAGKTSLLRLFNRLVEASAGDIYFENQPLRHQPVLALRQQVVFVPQAAKLLGMTAQQALTYPLTLRGLPPSTIQERYQTWVDRLQIPSDWLSRTETQLSTGQCQWLAIARALMIQPKVLLLDEPTATLDTARVDRLLNVLVDLAPQQTTVIMVNHQLHLASSLAQRFFLLQNGSLIQDDAIDRVDWAVVKQQIAEAENAQDW